MTGDSAREAYRDPAVAARYESDRYTSVLGRYTHRAEQRAAARLLAELPDGLEILDCPCGTGRWWPRLAPKASRLVGADISPAMRAEGARRAPPSGVAVEIVEADAERLPFAEDSFDLAFCFALTKHLPPPRQARVLAELARVSRLAVMCSFGVFDQVSRLVWNRRELSGSFPLERAELEQMARRAGLVVGPSHRCTTPVGTERLFLLRMAAGQRTAWTR